MASLHEPENKYESKNNCRDDIPKTDPEWHAFLKKMNVWISFLDNKITEPKINLRRRVPIISIRLERWKDNFFLENVP